jgi:hypothetical protein
MGAGISVVLMTNDYAFSRQVRRRNFQMFRRRSGTDDRRRWRIEVPVGVDDRLGTKAAHGEDQKDDLHPDPEGLEPGHASIAVTVSQAKHERKHHHRDDDSQYHQEMPYCAAIWRAFCSSVSRQVIPEREGGCLEACFLEAGIPKACLPEACGFAVVAVAGGTAAGGAAAAGASISAGTRSMRSAACAETEARAKAAIRTNLRT